MPSDVGHGPGDATTQPWLGSPAVIEAQTGIQQQQDGFLARLKRLLPDARVDHRYTLLQNGFAVRLYPDDVKILARFPEVGHIVQERRIAPALDASLPLIGLYSGTIPSEVDSGLWVQVGGHARAGAGVKIAVVDSGIDPGHPFLTRRVLDTSAVFRAAKTPLLRPR